MKSQEGFNITATPNHWSKDEKAIKHLEVIVFHYLMEKRKSSGLTEDQKALLTFDVFKGQKTERVMDIIESNNCMVVL